LKNIAIPIKDIAMIIPITPKTIANTLLEEEDIVEVDEELDEGEVGVITSG